MYKKVVLLLLVFFLISCTNVEVKEMKLTSSDFENNELIPSQYTCDGDNIPPELIIDDVPEGTKSLVLIMDDPDIPQEVKQARGIEVFDHWIMFNINPEVKKIEVGKLGKNSAGNNQYTGPCPPKQYQPTEHRYFFKLYALDVELDLAEGVNKVEVEKAMVGHILKQTELIGRYERK